MSADVVLYLGDKTPRELGMRVLRESQRPIAPPTVDNIVSIPNMHGAYDFGAYLGPRQMPLECALVARNSIELQKLVSDLAAYLIGPDGKPKTMPLIFRNQPDRQYYVRYSGDLQINRAVGLGLFTLPFTAYDPFAYGVQSTSDLLTWDTDYTWDDDFSWSDDYSFSFNGPGTVQINNFGKLNIEPVVEVTGSFSTLSLTIGGVVFSYISPMSGTLTIDFKRKTARIGTQNVLQNTNANFGKLPPGTSDLIVGGTNLNVTVDVIFNAKYPA